MTTSISRTGVVYHPIFASYDCLWDQTYVENPERYECIIRRCSELGLLERCEKIPARQVSTSEMTLCHDQHLLTTLQSTANMDVDQLKKVSSQYDCLYIHPNSWATALMAAGGVVDLVKAVVSGTVDNGMALVRPPGHHAMRDESCGYCYINNVAIGAKVALDMGLERILVIDWDVHHGQGTQRQFYDDPRVMYVSIHRYEQGYWWPNLPESNYDHIGSGPGAGYNVNIPLNVTGNGDTEYLHAWHQVVLPVAHEFQPQLVLISAGYDPAIGCPEGEQRVSPACFSHFTHSLMALAEGKVCAVLEGGYYPLSLAEGAALTLRTLLGDPCPPLPSPVSGQPNQAMKEAVRNVSISLAPYWTAFSVFRGQSPSEKVWLGPESPEQPPYDIMCPTPARSQEEEQEIQRQVQEMIANTDLSVPEFKIVGSKDVAEVVKVKEVVESPEKAQDLVKTGRTRCAIIGHKESERIDGLTVEITEKDNSAEVIIANEEGVLFWCGIKLDSESNMVQVINKKLLPNLYTLDPEILVLKCNPSSSTFEYLKHQLMVFRKLIVVLKA